MFVVGWCDLSLYVDQLHSVNNQFPYLSFDYIPEHLQCNSLCVLGVLPRDAMHKRGLSCRLPVHPFVNPWLSVRLSDTFVHSVHTAENIVKLFCRPGSPSILVFDLRHRYPIPWGTHSAGRKIQGSGKILRFSTEIAVYLRNGMVWSVNRKSYARYRMVTLSMTLTDS